MASSKSREKQISRTLHGIGEYFLRGVSPKLMGSLPITAGKKESVQKLLSRTTLVNQQHLINLKNKKSF